MSQEVLYRKWRPRRFADVVGQDAVVATLRNAVAAGTPAHAYLFTGPRGTGKTSVGRILAKALNCPTTPEGEPVADDPACIAYDEGRAIDLIELDAASNRGIDEVRALRESVGYSPSAGRYKVYLIDEVHMLTDAAFNALLKTLEEPPPHVVFVLATTEPHRIPATILSRCQRFDFRRITVDDIVRRLQVIAEGEGVQVDEEALRLIARQATGALRDAVNLLDQLIAFHGRVLDAEAVQAGLGLVVDARTRVLARAAVMGDLKGGLEVLAGARDDGLDIRAFVREVVATLRRALLLQAGADTSADLSDAQQDELRALVAETSPPAVVRALRALGTVDFSGDPYDSLPAEIAFASLVTGLGTTPEAASAAPPAASTPPQPAQARPAPARSTPPRSAPAREPAARRSPPQEAPARATQPPAAAPSPPERAAPARPPAPFEPPDERPASDETQRLRAEWDRIRETVRARSMRAGAMLNSGCYIKAHVPDAGGAGDTIELGFRFPKHVELVQSAENGAVLDAIREVMTEVLGRPVRVVPVLWEALQQSSTPPPPSRSGGGHLLEEARRHGAVPAEE